MKHAALYKEATVESRTIFSIYLVFLNVDFNALTTLTASLAKAQNLVFSSSSENNQACVPGLF